MVRHDRMYCVLGTAFRHVAIEAAGACTGHLRDVNRAGVTSPADLDVMLLSFDSSRDVVRIVTGEASHRRLPKACRLSKAVGGACNLEPIDTRTGLLVKMKGVIG